MPAIRFRIGLIALVLVTLGVTVAWADDWNSPPATTRSARPTVARAPRPKVSAATRAGYQQSSMPEAFASPAPASNGRMAASPSSWQEDSGELSADELFPSTGQIPCDDQCATPMRNCINGAGCLDGCGDDGDHEMAPPAGLTLSSGRWFNRGCWYAQEEFTFLERSERGRHKQFLVAEADPVIIYNSVQTINAVPNGPIGIDPPFAPYSATTTTTNSITYTVSGGTVVTGLPLQLNGNALLINPSLGFSPGARMTVGRKLGTDQMNRDSAIEFTFQGLNHWNQTYSITATDQFVPNSLFSRITPIPGTFISGVAGAFNFANSEQYSYSANLNSYELNFRLSKRMGRDRTVLTREGIWARVATPEILPSLYGGFRLIQYNEGFLWSARGIMAADPTGTYTVATHNGLFGLQMGGSLTYQHENWFFSGRLAGGALANWADQHSSVFGTAGTNSTGDTITAINRPNESNQNTTLSMMMDLGLNAVYLFRPNMGVRVGYQLLVLSNVALADRQLTFTSLSQPIMNNDHGIYFQGLSSGFEFTW